MKLILEKSLSIPALGICVSPDTTRCALLQEDSVTILSYPGLEVLHTLEAELPTQGVFLSDNSLLILLLEKNPILWTGSKLKKLAKWPLGCYDMPKVFRVDDHNLYFETDRLKDTSIWRFDIAHWRPLKVGSVPGVGQLYHCDESSLRLIRWYPPKEDRMHYDLLEVGLTGEVLHQSTTREPLEDREISRPIQTPGGNILISTLCAPATPERFAPEPLPFFTFAFTPEGRAYIPGEDLTLVPDPAPIPMLYLLDQEGNILAQRTDAEDVGQLFPVGDLAALVCQDFGTVSFWKPDILERVCVLGREIFGEDGPACALEGPDGRILVGTEGGLYCFRRET